jgi:hypothetical protein
MSIVRSGGEGKAPQSRRRRRARQAEIAARPVRNMAVRNMVEAERVFR